LRTLNAIMHSFKKLFYDEIVTAFPAISSLRASVKFPKRKSSNRSTTALPHPMFESNF